MSKTSRPIELCWVAPKRVPRIRRRPPWRHILDEAAHAPPDEPGDPALSKQDVPPEDRRDVLLILARADATDAEGVAAALSEGVHEDGKFAPPLVLVAGELRFPFGELETLKATVTTATPFVPGDEPLKAAVDAAKEFLAIPGLSPAPAVVEAITGRIRDAFGRIKRAVPPGYLEAQTERALLEQRRYQKRTFHGEPHLRALLQAPGDKGPMLVYLPEAVADRLPLYQRFGARIIAEAHLSVDQYETHTYALEALAIARELPAPPSARRSP
jgi:hypothetical protein